MAQPPPPPEAQSIPEPDSLQGKRARFRARLAFAILETVFIAAIAILWLASKQIRDSKSLWVLFLYAFPSEFILGALPHEPVLLYFGKYYSGLTVALVSIAGTVMAETINYTLFRFVADLKIMQKLLASRIISQAVKLFKKAPFAALCIAAFTPLPFYPFRFLVVISRYPLSLYILAILLSRTPRFYLLAVAGQLIRFSDYLLAIVFAVVVTFLYGPIAFRYLRKKLRRKTAAPGLPETPPRVSLDVESQNKTERSA